MTVESDDRGSDAASRIMLTPERAAGLAGVTPRRIKYWGDTFLITPTVDIWTSSRRRVRLYDVAAVTELLVVAHLATQFRLHVRHIRRVVDDLRGRDYASPLRELRFAVVDGEIYFQLPDGEWEAETHRRQAIIPNVVELEPIRVRVISESTRRPAELEGQISSTSGRRARRPVFAGTRIPVETVQHWRDDGASSARILEAFPALTERDLAALTA